jgi:hypothetical protein
MGVIGKKKLQKGKTKDTHLARGKDPFTLILIKVGNDNSTCIWINEWIGNVHLFEIFPCIFPFQLKRII